MQSLPCQWAIGPLGHWAIGPLGHWAIGTTVVKTNATEIQIKITLSLRNLRGKHKAIKHKLNTN